MRKNYFSKNFLNSNESDYFRDKFKNNFDFSKITSLEDFINLKNSQFLINQKFLSLLNENLDIKDYIFLNIAKIQKRTSYNINPKLGWHKDYGGKKDQLKILSKKNNFIFKIGIYLQKNEKNLGGGIDLLKTIFFDNLTINNPIMIIIRRVYYYFLIKFFNNRLKTNKGDLVAFNGMVYHRTSPMKVNKVDSVIDKYNIYFLITNLDTIKDAIKSYDKKYNTQNYEAIDKNIFTKKLYDSKISLCSKEYSKFVESILGD